MRARQLVLHIAAFFACLAFIGCGPSFKSAREKSPAGTVSKPTPSAPGASQAEEVNGEAPSAAPGIQLISLNDEAKALADKLVIGASLEKGDKKNTLTVVMKDNVSDAKPNVELTATFGTEESSGKVSNDSLQFAQIAGPIDIKKDEYSVDYRCFGECSDIEVNVQRMTGDKTGFRVSLRFELDGAEKIYVLKKSSMSIDGKLLSANEARQLADPVLGTAPAVAFAAAAVTPAPVAADATAAAVVPPPAVDRETIDLRALQAKINELPNPTIRHKMPTCDKNSPAFKREVEIFKREVIAARIAAAEKAGIVLSDDQKKDPRLFKVNEPWFPLGSRCNPRPIVANKRVEAAKAPVAKAPVVKAPIAKVPVAKTPAPKPVVKKAPAPNRGNPHPTATTSKSPAAKKAVSKAPKYASLAEMNAAAKKAAKKPVSSTSITRSGLKR